MTATLTRPAPAAAAKPATPATERVLWKGNEAMAEAAIQAGCDAYFGYPITPQAELLEWMARRMPELGRVFVQAESELGAINMAMGAAAQKLRREFGVNLVLSHTRPSSTPSSKQPLPCDLDSTTDLLNLFGGLHGAVGA